MLFSLSEMGPVAEWLGRALQKLLQRFESARDLDTKPLHESEEAFLMRDRESSLLERAGEKQKSTTQIQDLC